MKAVVDTNVVAYLLLGTETFVDEARTCFEAVSDPVAPAHWEAELTNVVWMAVRTGVLPAEEGPARLGLARRLGIESVATATLCQGALLRAVTGRRTRIRHALRRTRRPCRLSARDLRQGRPPCLS